MQRCCLVDQLELVLTFECGDSKLSARLCIVQWHCLSPRLFMHFLSENRGLADPKPALGRGGGTAMPGGLGRSRSGAPRWGLPAHLVAGARVCAWVPGSGRTC